MFSEVVLLVLIKPVDNLFDEIASKEAITIISQCVDYQSAKDLRENIAHLCGHGDKLVIFHSNPSNREATVDTYVIVDGRVS